MMTQTHGYLTQTQADSPKELFYTLFRNDTVKLRASILIIHGMQEHSGRYVEFASYLADQGYAVLTYDHMGHGNSVKNRDELSFFQRKGASQQLVQDAQDMAKMLEEAFPHVPRVLLGHSMGSFVARNLLQKDTNTFDAAILVGTGAKTKGIKFLKTVVDGLNYLQPYKRSWINRVFNKMNNNKFKDEPGADDSSWLSVDIDNRKRFKADERCGVPFTNNGFHTLIELNIQATKDNWHQSIRKELPILFVSGEDDPIGQFGKGIRQIVADLKQHDFTQVSFKLYPKMRHEILNETIKQDVYTDISQWLEAIFPAAKP